MSRWIWWRSWEKSCSFYHLVSIDDFQKIDKIKEVGESFLRDSDLSVPSLYEIFKGSDWQERETYDMFGIIYSDHPNPKRLLMPEDWRGWPLRKIIFNLIFMNYKMLIIYFLQLSIDK